MRFSGRQSSGWWFRCATVSVLLCVSNRSPGFLHCLPHFWHFQPAASLTAFAIRRQSAGYRFLSIGTAKTANHPFANPFVKRSEKWLNVRVISPARNAYESVFVERDSFTT